jgi:hypothetical protein
MHSGLLAALAVLFICPSNASAVIGAELKDRNPQALAGFFLSRSRLRFG